MSLSKTHDLLRVYVDTNVVTFYPFLERPDEFLHPEANHVVYQITLPVVRELERIKDEHFSSGQRKRARAVLDRLEESERGMNGIRLTECTSLRFAYIEPPDTRGSGGNVNQNSPDDQFIACVYRGQRFDQSPLAVLSADVGVRLRAKHQIPSCIVYQPDETLRLTSEEDFNLPQLVKATVKELAKQLAAELRQHPK